MLTLPLFPQFKGPVALLLPFFIYGWWRWGLPRVRLTDPAQRYRVLWLLTMLPLLDLPLIGIDLHSHSPDLLHHVYFGLGPLLTPELRHRLFHHPPLYARPMPFRLLPLTMLLVRLSGMSLAVVIGVWEYFLAAWRIRRLPQYAATDVVVLRVPGWTAFTFGLLHPRIYLSEAVWNSPHCAAILAHERAHAQRRDPLRRLVAHSVRRLLWYLPVWERLGQQMEFEAERICDARACDAVSRPRYASALLAFAEQAQSMALPPRLAPGLDLRTYTEAGETDLLARAQAIARPNTQMAPRWFWQAFALCYVLVTLLA